LEQHWRGVLLDSLATVLNVARTMTYVVTPILGGMAQKPTKLD